MNNDYRTVSITRGALNHRYFPLSQIRDFFPEDVVGGKNRSTEAQRKVKIHWGAGDAVRSDIAGDKNVFRERAWVSSFYEAHGIEKGDEVAVERIAKYVYHIYPLRESE